MSPRLKRLSVTGFRLFDALSVDTDSDLVCFHGLNATGKTSLLEAIHYLCLGRGYFSQTDQQNIRFGGSFFRIEGTLVTGEYEHEVVCVLEEGKRKSLKMDGATYDRLGDHLGKFPVVVIAPDDIAIVTGGGDRRRAFMDNMFSQVSRDYREHLQSYVRALRQRNAILKQFGETGQRDIALLKSYDIQLIPSGDALSKLRAEHMQEFTPVLDAMYRNIADDAETPGCTYRSDLAATSMADILKHSLEADMAMQRTTRGIHRDDLLFTLDERAAGRYGSQGQVKTFLVALKMAMFHFLKVHLGITPILLLDDLFDKLDNKRAKRLLAMACSGDTSQVFITDTQPSRIGSLMPHTEKGVAYVAIGKQPA